MSNTHACPTVWSREFEGQMDSNASRDFGFAALNRMSAGQLYRWWRRTDEPIDPEHEPGPNVPPGPSWLRPWFRAHPLRYCRMCIQAGYHSYFHQLPGLAECPWHAVTLTTKCPWCRRPGAYSGEGCGRLACLSCHRELFPRDPRAYLRDASFLQSETRAFGPLFERLRAWEEIELDTRCCLGSQRPPSQAEIALALLRGGVVPLDDVFARALLPPHPPRIDVEVMPIRSIGFANCALFREELEEARRRYGERWTEQQEHRLQLVEYSDYRVGGEIVYPPSSPRVWVWVMSYCRSGDNSPFWTDLRDALVVKTGQGPYTWIVIRPVGGPSYIAYPH